MSVIKHLMQYRTVLNDAKRGTFLEILLLKSSVKGNFQGYDAEFGSFKHKLFYEIFYRIRLKSRFKIPLFLWDKCPVHPYNVNLCYGKWLTISEWIGGDRIEETIDAIGGNSVRNCFIMLTEVAHKLESGKIALENASTLEKKTLIKDILILIPIIIFVVALEYWWNIIKP